MVNIRYDNDILYKESQEVKIGNILNGIANLIASMLMHNKH